MKNKYSVESQEQFHLCLIVSTKKMKNQNSVESQERCHLNITVSTNKKMKNQYIVKSQEQCHLHLTASTKKTKNQYGEESQRAIPSLPNSKHQEDGRTNTPWNRKSIVIIALHNHQEDLVIFNLQ